MLRDAPLQDAGQISRNRGADSNPSLTALLHPISLLTEPEGLLSADWLRCVFMPFRHSVSHKCSVTHNDRLGAVPGIYPCAVLGSATLLKFLFILPENMWYSVTFVYYAISFSVCFFCHGHLCYIDRCHLCGEAKQPGKNRMRSHSISQVEVPAMAVLQNK